MKIQFIFLFLLLPLFIDAQENLVNVNTEIKSVTVYLNGAQIDRQANIPMKKGHNKLVFKNLSAYLSSTSIQFKTNNEISILSVIDKAGIMEGNDFGDEMKKIKDSVDLLTNEKARLNNELKSYQVELELLNNHNKFNTTEHVITIEELKEAADFFRTRNKLINDKILEINGKILMKTSLINELDIRYAKLNTRSKTPSKEIVIEVLCPQAGTFPFEIKYLVSMAGWKPSYDIRAEDIDKPIQFIYKAAIYNKSGIDWKQVSIVLSTADPTMSAAKPSLTAWNLNYYQASYGNEGYTQNIQVQREYYPASKKIEAGDTFTWQTETPGSISVAELNAEFEISNKHNIITADAPYLVEVRQDTLPASYEHFSIPKVDRDAFMLARITGWEELNIIDGPANIYYGGLFLGTSYINTRNLKDTLDLSLGRDTKVLVTRNKRKDYSSDQLLGSYRKETFTYEINVKNNRKLPVTIEIQDQIPVSQDDDIKIEKINISGATLEELSGKLSWKYTLEPGGTKNLIISFSVKYSSKRNLNIRKSRTISSPSF